MPERLQFSSVHFKNYKALKQYSIALRRFNILVGPNNSGKSTILGAFRILSEGMRKAAAKNPELLRSADGTALGYRVPLNDIPIATENVFSNYDDSEPAIIDFRLSNGNRIELQFPEPNLCYMFCRTKRKPVRFTIDFRREYPVSVGFVPVLGPVEHDERLNEKETARRALLTHRASRNFRNIWYHFGEEFDEFREMIRSTWPGMDIKRPELDHFDSKAFLRMFCPEERYPRELYWAGFGFQVWCQMLTFIVKARNDSLLIIDEPDIYLHSDLQRQLIGLLKEAASDVLIATHSTEIISEADPGDILVINKKVSSAKRIGNPSQLQTVFGALGSNLNPTLTQLAKTRRAIFVEGNDFRILAGFARKLSHPAIANRGDFAVVSSEGFNPTKVRDVSEGIEATLGTTILKAAVFDRDYRSDSEIAEVLSKLRQFVDLAHIHRRKELENYLLEPMAIQRAIQKQIEEHNRRTDAPVSFEATASDVLMDISDTMRARVAGQFLAKRTEYEKSKHPHQDYATINQRLVEEFEDRWKTWESRVEMLPGKEMLSGLNRVLQEHYKISITTLTIVGAMTANEIPEEIKNLIREIEKLRLRRLN